MLQSAVDKLKPVRNVVVEQLDLIRLIVVDSKLIRFAEPNMARTIVVDLNSMRVVVELGSEQSVESASVSVVDDTMLAVGPIVSGEPRLGQLLAFEPVVV